MEKRARAGAAVAWSRWCRVSFGVLGTAAVIAVLLLGWQAIEALHSAQHWPIRYVHVVGEREHLARTDIRQALAPLVKHGFFAADLGAVESALEALPWTADASVRRVWPDTLKVRVSEQTAAARWGNSGVLNAQGELFRPREDEIPRDLPVLYGPKDRKQVLISRYLRMSGRLQAIGLSLRALVQDERRAWHLLLEGGVPVELGRGEPRSRLARFIRAWPTVLAGRAEQIESIDLRYTNGFAVAWEAGAASADENGKDEDGYDSEN